MLRYGYDERLALGTIAASGTLGQVIPPSVVLIVLGDQLGVSVGTLFARAFAPGLALAGAFMLYVAGVAFFRPAAAPALPPEARATSGRDLARRVVLSLLPPLVLILVVLGSIFAGIATPTEAGALGAVGSLVLAALNRQLNMRTLHAAMAETSRITVMVTFLLIGTTAFTLVFRGLSGDVWIADTLSGLPGGAFGFLLVVNLVVFVLGFFIDFIEIAFIVVPLIILPAQRLGVDLAWLGIVLAVNMQTSFLTPPFGFSLFYLRGVMPKRISTLTLYRGVVPFIIVQLVVLTAFILLTLPRAAGAGAP
jgi:tripartite ATP-independent transporter DctM subunit